MKPPTDESISKNLTQEEDPLTLEPLPQFSMFIPEDWKDAVYGLDGSGSTEEGVEWWQSKTE